MSLKNDSDVIALSAFVERSIIEATPEAFMEGLAKESDRGAIILAVTLLEDSLAEAVNRASGVNQANRNLGFSLKKAAEYNLASPDQLLMLDYARVIRNACAHARSEISFATPELRAVALKMFEITAGSEPPSAWDSAQLRTLFLTVCVVTSKLIGLGLSPEPDELAAQLGESPIMTAIGRFFTGEMRHWHPTEPTLGPS